MSDVPAPIKKTRKPRTATKKVQPSFAPIDPGPGDKPFISHDAQRAFVALLGSMTDDERKGAIAVLNYVVKGPGVQEGYRKVLHWWRAYAPQINADNVQL